MAIPTNGQRMIARQKSEAIAECEAIAHAAGLAARQVAINAGPGHDPTAAQIAEETEVYQREMAARGYGDGANA